MFFEGSEKKVEIVVSGQPLRALGRPFWENIVAKSSATILSTLSDTQCDAYLLSESSLFVWDDRFLMITCGTITLADAIEAFVADYPLDKIELLVYQRKNEYQSHLQKTSFEQDIQRLSTLLDGSAMRLGHLDGHHNYVFHLNKPYQPHPEDVTTELLMYHISSEAAELLRSPAQTAAQVRELFQFDRVLAEFQIDDFVFTPFGYSMNGIDGQNYITMHITPQEDTSYVSFETNLNLEQDFPELIDHFIKVLGPKTFDLINFNVQPRHQAERDYVDLVAVEQPISCGYTIRFNHFFHSKRELMPAERLHIG